MLPSIKNETRQKALTVHMGNHCCDFLNANWTYIFQIIPGLREVCFKNDAAHPNAAAVLSVCAARRVPNATVKFAADVTEAGILDFVFDNNSADITREFGITYLYRSVSGSFFESIVEVRLD